MNSVSSTRGRKKVVTKDGKVVLQVLISRDLYEKLVQVAPAIYGKTHGSVSYVVEEALKQYLLPRLHTQTRTNPRGSIRRVYNEIVEKVKEIMHLDFKPTEVPEKILDLAISETRGSDPRTIEKWKSLLSRSGLIKFVGGVKPNRIVELL